MVFCAPSKTPTPLALLIALGRGIFGWKKIEKEGGVPLLNKFKLYLYLLKHSSADFVKNY